MKKNRFWAFIGATSMTLLIASAASAAEGELITEFSENDSQDLEWRVVDDRVMGGRSQGKMVISDDGILKFSGNLSLENNGGFSSIRSGDVKLDFSAAEGVVLRVKGDGRTYEVHFSTPARWKGRGITFAGLLPTEEGQWTDVKIPFSEFEGDFRGQRLKDEASKFDPAAVRGITLELVDKKAGAFELQVDWIRTYGTSKRSSADR